MKELTPSIHEPMTQVYAPLLVTEAIFNLAIAKFSGTLSDNSESFTANNWAELIDWINDGLKNDGYTFYNNVYQSQNNISTRGLHRNKQEA